MLDAEYEELTAKTATLIAEVAALESRHLQQIKPRRSSDLDPSSKPFTPRVSSEDSSTTPCVLEVLATNGALLST
jgi:hypothetical protein